MPMLRPIGAELLPDSMTVAVPDPDAAYGGEYLEPVTVSNVRFEGAATLEATGYKLADGARGRIWMDAANSAGAFGIPVGSRIALRGEDFACLCCMPYEGFGGEVHHWEVDVA